RRVLVDVRARHDEQVPLDHVVLVEEREMRRRQVGHEKSGLGTRERIVRGLFAGRVLAFQLCCAADDECDPGILDRAGVRLDAMQDALGECTLGLAPDAIPEVTGVTQLVGVDQMISKYRFISQSVTASSHWRHSHSRVAAKWSTNSSPNQSRATSDSRKMPVVSMSVRGARCTFSAPTLVPVSGFLVSLSPFSRPSRPAARTAP